MRHTLIRLLSSIIALAVLSLIAYGQGSTSSLSGTVADPNGAVVAGATVTVKDNATGAEFKAVTVGNGTFIVPTLNAGTYTVVVSMAGFKQALISDVKLDAGTPASVRVSLEVGNTNETVTVQGGGEVVQTQSANIATTLQTSQIVNLPLVSRNPLNFVVLLPGVSTTRINRDSTINGLPQSAIDITLDGINIQDNFNKTGDGFFTRVAPSLDSIEEVTVSTATPEAQGGSMGAVSIKFVTRSGSNDFHGSLYEYHRNPWLNAAYWFTNRDTTPLNVEAGRLCNNLSTGVPYDPEKCHAQRARVLFNQYGGRLGGPITLPKSIFGPLGFDGRNKAFFFVNFEASSQPSQVARQRTILNPLTQAGTFQYNVTVNNQVQVRTVNLLTLAQANGQTATIDPVIGKLLSDIRNATNGIGGITQLTDPNLQRFSYNPSGSNSAKRPTVRFDFNLTDKHRLESTWTYTDQRGGPDFLNNVEPKFPGFPNQGSQPADRYAGSVAVRSTLTPTLVNEARAGMSGGPSRFNPTATSLDFVGAIANQAGFNLGGATGNNSTGIAAAAGIDGATATSAPSRRNPKFSDISDTLTWTRGAHSLTFGGKFVWTTLTFNAQTLVPTVNFGVDANDPANAMFNTTNFQGASNTDLTNARGIYAVLTGRITAINANARLDETTGKYVYLGTGFERSRQKEFGVFAQDSWRFRPNLTLNFGLRWEVQGPFTTLNDSYTTTSVADLFGISGAGNLFKPNVQTGRVTQFVQFKGGTGGYNTDYKDFAPSFGFAWSPSAKDGWLKHLVGDGGQTVIRGGYAIAYNRQGIGDFRGVFSANPGSSITTNRDLPNGTLVGGSLGSLPLLLREANRLGPPAFPTTPIYPLTGAPFVANTNSANIYDPNIKVPYTQSWTFGIQREIAKDMAIEARYVHTLNLQQWVTFNLNETNIVENGFLNEFRLAQANLQANIAAGRGNTFRYFGPGTNTSPLPIYLAYFSGVPAAQAGDQSRYTSTNFSSTNFTNPLALNNPAPGTPASNNATTGLFGNATRIANAIAAGLPENFFRANPGLASANFTGNGGYSRFDALQLEFRRRMAKGLLVGANYQFAKAFFGSRQGGSFRRPRVNTLDNATNGNGTLRHAFKVNWIYELPIGRGKTFFGNAGGVVDKLIGGWEFQGTGRVQSGEPLDYGNVNLVGMTRDDLQKAYKLRFDDAGKIAYILPDDIILNTRRAFGVSATDPTGYGSLGVPTGRYIAPANSRTCIQVVAGDCAPNNVIVFGPRFTRFDLSMIKRIKINERVNFEMRAEFLNAFNHINFFGSVGSVGGATFGQITTAYTDSSNTNDPGGRLGQIVLRLNF